MKSILAISFVLATLSAPARASYAPLALAVAAATVDSESDARDARLTRAPAVVPSPADAIADKVRRVLAIRYPEARIELTRPLAWIGGGAIESADSVVILEETPRAEVKLLVRGQDSDGQATQAQAFTSFAAWVPARVAARRITPGERLSPELFLNQETNIASGQPREFRGVILGEDTKVNGLETRQTILEGQLLLSTAVQRIPDVRRGDAIRIHMVSGGLSLTTLGTAEEPGFLRSRVRILTTKGKRELVGTLLPGGIVEVTL